jgi:hypothetical protein
MSGQWKKLSNYTVEHVSGSRVNKINEDKFEVWMLDENRKYFHAGMFADRNQALRIAAEHDIGAARERRAKAQLNAEWVAENESGEAVTPAKWA